MEARTKLNRKFERGGKNQVTAQSKIVTMREAISRHVLSGSMVLLGAQLEPMIPFAAGHEIIRQGRRNLTLVGPISDILFDQLIGAGCVERVMAAWVGNVSEGAGYCFRRAVEQGTPKGIDVVDYSNFTLALALHAGALGVPFLPTYATLGSDLHKTNGNLREFASPVSEEKLVAVRALRPDVAIIHVQRADAQGNAHVWGSLGVAVDGARASRSVIIITEEIVPEGVIASDPNRTLIPGFLVTAVVHEPWGAHPSPVQGHYNRDHAYFGEYHAATRELSGFESWLQKNVLSVTDRGEYLKLLSEKRTEKLEVQEHAMAATADFGY